MKLNHELVREVLLYVEKNFNLCEDKSVYQIEIEGYSKEDIVYSCLRLIEADYLNGHVRETKSYPLINIKGITWKGHEYLDSIRNQTVWEKAKEIASGFGSVSLTMMGNIAQTVATNIITNTLAGKF